LFLNPNVATPSLAIWLAELIRFSFLNHCKMAKIGLSCKAIFTSYMSKHKKTTPSTITNKTQSAAIATKPIEPVAAVQGSVGDKFAKWISAVLVAVVALLVFVNSKDNTFVLDDHGIIKANKITKAGISSDNLKLIFTSALRKGDVTDNENSLYRPMPKAIFAAEWQISKGDPSFFHKVNIAFYILCCIAIYLVLFHALKRNWLLAASISLLYAVHPIHSEVVANVKSLDEILGMLGTMVAIRFMQMYVDRKNALFILPAFVAFMVGMFSKESNVVAVALVPLVLYYFHNANLKQLLIAGGTIALGFALFMLCRDNAIGQFGPMKPPSALDNVLALTRRDPAVMDSYEFSKFFPTVVYLMGYYVYKLFFPLTLSCDYSYASVTVQDFSSPYFWMSFLFFAGIIVYGIYTIKKKTIIGFGIWWFLISSSIISNLFIVIGTSFGDRLMFMPSLGWAVAICAAIWHFAGYAKREWQTMKLGESLAKHSILSAVVLLIGIPFSIKAIQRNEEWRRDRTLFAHDIKDYPNSTHLMFYWGNHISSNEFAEGKTPAEALRASLEAVSTFRRSLGFYPALPSDGYNQFGKAFYNLYKANPAELGAAAAGSLAGNGAVLEYGEIAKSFLDSNIRKTFLDSAQKYYLQAHKEDTTNHVFMNNIGTVYFEQGSRLGRMDWFDSAQRYFYAAHRRDTTVIDYMNNMGALVGTKGQPMEAIAWLAKGYHADSLSLGAVLSCKMIGGTYRNLGDSVNSRAWYNVAASVEAYRKAERDAQQ
jgi:protein O-mannosyl-transferase